MSDSAISELISELRRVAGDCDYRDRVNLFEIAKLLRRTADKVEELNKGRGCEV